MNTVQLGARSPSNLKERLTSFISQMGMSKTEVVINALASYMGCDEEIALTEEIANLDAKVAMLEALVKGS
jgi:hypothetical protein